MRRLIKSVVLSLLKIQIYVFGFLFLVSMMAYAIVECGLGDGVKKFEEFLNLVESGIYGGKK